jgi:hypothetical protein
MTMEDHKHIWAETGAGCYCGTKQCDFWERLGSEGPGYLTVVRCQRAAGPEGRCQMHVGIQCPPMPTNVRWLSERDSGRRVCRIVIPKEAKAAKK